MTKMDITIDSYNRSGLSFHREFSSDYALGKDPKPSQTWTITHSRSGGRIAKTDNSYPKAKLWELFKILVQTGVDFNEFDFVESKDDRAKMQKICDRAVHTLKYGADSWI